MQYLEHTITVNIFNKYQIIDYTIHPKIKFTVEKEKYIINCWEYRENPQLQT
jgi:hypothetical protein